MRKSNKKAVIIFLVVAAVIVLIYAVGQYLTNRRTRTLTEDIDRYAVTQGDLSFSAVGSGKIESADVKTVIVQGNITEITVKLGDYVKADDKLAEYTTVTGAKRDFLSEHEGVITAIPAGGYDTATGRQSAPAFEISRTDKLLLTIQATEKDIYKIKNGQKASVYIDALDITVNGIVSRVSLAGKTAGDFSTYDVTVSFDKQVDNIYLGMTGSAKILIGSKKNVVLVPVDAIIEQNGKRYVLKSEWLEHLNKPKSDYYVEVKTGLADTDYAEITEGDITGKEILIINESTFSFPRMNNR